MTQFRQEKKCWHEHQKFHMFEKLMLETLDLVEKRLFYAQYGPRKTRV